MIRFSAFSDEVTEDFNGQAEFLVSQNIRNIEIRFVNSKNILDLDQEELAEAKLILNDHGIAVSAIASPIGKVKIDEPFEKHLSRFKHAIEIDDYLHAPFIRIFSYYPPDGKSIEAYREEVLSRMAAKAELVKGSTVVLVHENEAHIYGHSAGNCVDLVTTINSEHLKLAYDPANFVWGERIVNSMESCWPEMKPHVVHVHIKDWKLGSSAIGSIPGHGDGQVKALIQELADMNYTGYLTMEPHLRQGGRFGGCTGPELFSEAINATVRLCDEAGLMHDLKVGIRY